jgi:hypothetical protein
MHVRVGFLADLNLATGQNLSDKSLLHAATSGDYGSTMLYNTRIIGNELHNHRVAGNFMTPAGFYSTGHSLDLCL